MKTKNKLSGYQIVLIVVSVVLTALTIIALFSNLIMVNAGGKYSGFSLQDLKILSTATTVKYYNVIKFFTILVSVLTFLTAVFTIVYALNGKIIEKYTQIALSFINFALALALTIIVIVFCATYTKGEQVVYGLGEGIIFIILSAVITFPIVSFKLLKNKN